MVVRSLITVLAAAAFLIGLTQTADASTAEQSCNKLYAAEQHALATYKIDVHDYGKNSETATRAKIIYEDKHYLYTHQCG